ncbi:MAG TPA: hypothetical protein PKU89_00400, partial [Kiritimatiellia bacterium]|nr:hypothetical protein [Kiritimatiellia bacterium]
VGTDKPQQQERGKEDGQAGSECGLGDGTERHPNRPFAAFQGYAAAFQFAGGTHFGVQRTLPALLPAAEPAPKTRRNGHGPQGD